MSTARRPRVLLALGGLTLALLTGCGSSGGTPDTAAASTPSSSPSSAPSSSPASTSVAAAAPVVVHISGFAFRTPPSVAPGATVSVMNMDGEAHTVTADAGGGFDVQVPAGATVTFTAPTAPGSYAFSCTYHSNMHGVLVVG